MFPTPVPINARAPYQSAVLATVLVLTCGCVSGDRDTGNEAGTDNAAVDALFADFDQPGSPGCGLAVAREGNLIYSRGYGYANLDHGIRNNPDILFDVGSVTKQFTAAGISMLALEGKLSLDDDILEWLPELPAGYATISISSRCRDATTTSRSHTRRS